MKKVVIELTPEFTDSGHSVQWTVAFNGRTFQGRTSGELPAAWDDIGVLLRSLWTPGAVRS